MKGKNGRTTILVRGAGNHNDSYLFYHEIGKTYTGLLYSIVLRPCFVVWSLKSMHRTTSFMCSIVSTLLWVRHFKRLDCPVRTHIYAYNTNTIVLFSGCSCGALTYIIISNLSVGVSNIFALQQKSFFSLIMSQPSIVLKHIKPTQAQIDKFIN